MGRIAKAEQVARARVRDRRVHSLYPVSRDRDARVEAAAVEVLLGLSARDHAAHLVSDAETRVGAALRRILAEDITVEQAATLCGRTIGNVRGLSRGGRSTSSRAKGRPRRQDASVYQDGQRQ